MWRKQWKMWSSWLLQGYPYFCMNHHTSVLSGSECFHVILILLALHHTLETTLQKDSSVSAYIADIASHSDVVATANSLNNALQQHSAAINRDLCFLQKVLYKFLSTFYARWASVSKYRNSEVVRLTFLQFQRDQWCKIGWNQLFSYGLRFQMP